MTLSDELKQEAGREATRAMLQYTLIVFITNLCFQMLLACPEPAICRSKLFKSLTSFKSMFISQWVGSACVFFYNTVNPLPVDDITDPEKAASAQRIDNFIMNYALFYLVVSPFAFVYLRKVGWFQDDDTLEKKSSRKKKEPMSDKEEDTSSDKDEDTPSEKEDDYVLPAGVRKRRLQE